MTYADYHIHTKLCNHASGEMYEYVEAAIEKGIKEIAFTDHIPLPNQFDIAHRMQESDLDLYVEEIEKLRTKYPEISIKCGIEADYYEGFEDYLFNFFQYYDFELVIMSVHFVKDWPDNNWAFSYYFPDKSFKDIYGDYLRAMQKGIKSGLFDIIGHFDIIKSEDEPILKHCREEVEETLLLASEQNMAVEINTSGLRRAISEPYPNLEILPLITKYNLPLTLGSDAHKPDDVGYLFDEISKLILKEENIMFAKF